MSTNPSELDDLGLNITTVNEEPVKGSLMKIDLNSPDAPEALIKVFSDVLHSAGFTVLRTPEEINRYFENLVKQAKVELEP